LTEAYEISIIFIQFKGFHPMDEKWHKNFSWNIHVFFITTKERKETKKKG
jgi:hypothetical protein